MKVTLAAALLGVATLLAGSPSDQVPRCHGRPATIVGTDGPDVLRGTSHRDVIWAGGGDDVVYGGLGSDVICGGAGSDVLYGGRGNDIVDGGAGDGDVALGGFGDDRVFGGPGNGDEVGGDVGIDILDGGPGNGDIVHGDYGYDRMDGGPGSGDIASFATAVAGLRGTGVWASLAAHRARGDGHDKLFRFEGLQGSAFGDTLIGDRRDNTISGGAGDDRLRGGGGIDTLDGGEGSDVCRGAPGRMTSCGRAEPLHVSAYVQLDPAASGGDGVEVVGGGGDDHLTVSYDQAASTLTVRARKGVGVGGGCDHLGPAALNVAVCPIPGVPRWLMIDLGPGDDTLRVRGSLAAFESVRISGGTGNDTIHGGPEDDLIQAAQGSDRIFGGAGSDGLIGSLPGPTWLYGGPGDDLVAAGGGCAGGVLNGGPGRDNASFAETPAHPGVLVISLAAGVAYDNAIHGCRRVHLVQDESIEGSFDNDVLIGDAGANALYGQPGADRFYGRGGNDAIDARDGGRDLVIQCGSSHTVRTRHGTRTVYGPPSGFASVDSSDPAPIDCAGSKQGHPVPGLRHHG